MAEYIKREVAVKVFNNFDAGRADGPPITLLTPEEFAEYLYEPPTADVASVVHGKWERVANPNWPAHIHDKCSLCGWWNTRNALCYDGRKGHSLNYCPNCGAKMDGGSGDAAD